MCTPSPDEPLVLVPPPVIIRQDASIMSLFDLPAELRMLIYSHISKVVHGTHSEDEWYRVLDDRLKIDGLWTRKLHIERHDVLSSRHARFLDLQLVSRQVRLEFLEAWAETIDHHKLLIDDGRPYRACELRCRTSKEISGMIFTTVRTMLHDMENRLGVARHVRHIKLFVRLTTYITFEAVDRLARFSSAAVASQLERLDESVAHPELVIEVQMVCTHPWDATKNLHAPGGNKPAVQDKHRRARRVICFMSNDGVYGRVGRTYRPDWRCTVDRMEVRNVLGDDRTPCRVEWVATGMGLNVAALVIVFIEFGRVSLVQDHV